MLAAGAREPFLAVLAGALAVLLIASAVARGLRARGGGIDTAELDNLDARIRSWWVMVALLAGAAAVGYAGVVALFAVVSWLALRELIANAPGSIRDPALDRTCTALVVLQYALVAHGDARLATVALPLVAPPVLAAVALASGGGRDLGRRVARRLPWLVIAGWGLSYVPLLVALDAPESAGGGILLFVWLIVVAQGSDVLQYIVGKLAGRRRIAPVVSPDKTVEGFVGGAALAVAIGAALHGITPFDPRLAALAALVVTTLGFAGGLVLSGWKRRYGIKDWGRTIRGHGGVLDRVDSLWLSAPALYGVAAMAVR